MVHDKITQPMLSADLSSIGYYVENKEAIYKAHKFLFPSLPLKRAFDVDRYIIMLRQITCTYVIFSCIL